MSLSFDTVTGTAAISPATAQPEDVFLAWLLWLPRDADLLEAASREIHRIDSRAVDADGPRQLKALFTVLVENLRSGNGH
jgi:hypothetical protein